MKNVYKFTVYALIILILSTLFAGCGESQRRNIYNPLSDSDSFEGAFAENERHTLVWDSNYRCVSIKSKKTGETVWCSIPEELYKKGFDKTNQLCSPISVSYLEPDTNLVKTAEGSTEIKTVSVEKLKNGIKVFYDFSNFEICVPVSYELTKDGISVFVNSDEITENTYRVFQISLMPYMASARNSKDTVNNWLFIPYGSGALMYTDDSTRSLRKFEGDVYGEDLSINTNERFNTDESIKLPIFGAKSGENSVFAIISSGAEYASLTAQAGNSEIGYSNVYASFKVRGYNTVLVDNVGAAGKSDAIVRISDETVSDTYRVDYYLLSDTNTVFEMADIYRKYLDSVYGESETYKQPIYQLEFLGGTYVDDFFMGIPYDKFVTATDFSQVGEMLKEVSDNTGKEGISELRGFGKSGLDYGEIAGGYEFSKEFGKKEEFKDINKNLFINFDLVRFSSGSNGFSAFWDSAKNANNSTANQYYYSITDKVKNENKKYFKLLKRSAISEAIDKLLKFSDKKSFSNISLNSLGDIAYSDYSNKKYVAKGNIDSDTSGYITKLRDSKKTVMVSNANDYAAINADIIQNVPLGNGAVSAFDEEIPFYSIVFKGSKAVISAPLNWCDNMRNEFLKAISCGIGLQFSFCAEYDDDFRDATFGADFAKSVYSDIKTDAIELIKSGSDIINKVKDAQIISWQKLENGITVTEFDNGIKIYVNFSDKEVNTECGLVNPMDFRYIERR